MLTSGLRGQSGPGAVSGRKLLVSNYRYSVRAALGASAVGGQLAPGPLKELAMFIGLVIVIAVFATYMMLRRRRRP